MNRLIEGDSRNRFDELLKDLDYYIEEGWSVEFDTNDIVYLTALLRAGRELREAADERYVAEGCTESVNGYRYPHPGWMDLELKLFDYDNAINGGDQADHGPGGTTSGCIIGRGHVQQEGTQSSETDRIWGLFARVLADIGDVEGVDFRDTWQDLMSPEEYADLTSRIDRIYNAGGRDAPV